MEKESSFQTMEEQLRLTKEQADRDKELLEAQIAQLHVKEEAADDKEECGGMSYVQITIFISVKLRIFSYRSILTFFWGAQKYHLNETALLKEH